MDTAAIEAMANEGRSFYEHKTSATAEQHPRFEDYFGAQSALATPSAQHYTIDDLIENIVAARLQAGLTAEAVGSERSRKVKRSRNMAPVAYHTTPTPRPSDGTTRPLA